MSYDKQRVDDMRKWAVQNLAKTQELVLPYDMKACSFSLSAAYLELARTIEWGGDAFLEELDIPSDGTDATRFLAKNYQRLEK